MCYGCCCLLAAAVLAPVLSLSHPCVAEVWLSCRADVLQTLAVPRLSCICWEQGREIFLITAVSEGEHHQDVDGLQGPAAGSIATRCDSWLFMGCWFW